MMHLQTMAWAAAVAAATIVGTATADEVDVGGMKSKTPASWKEEKAGGMRMAQFKLPKAEGDSEDAEVVVFYFKGGSGSVDANFARQRSSFRPAEGKDKVEEKTGKTMVGKLESPWIDLTGTYLHKVAPFDPKGKTVEKPAFRQLYVVALVENAGDYYFRLNGPVKTVAKHEKEFLDWLKNFK